MIHLNCRASSLPVQQPQQQNPNHTRLKCNNLILYHRSFLNWIFKITVHKFTSALTLIKYNFSYSINIYHSYISRQGLWRTETCCIVSLLYLISEKSSRFGKCWIFFFLKWIHFFQTNPTFKKIMISHITNPLSVNNF